jgi:predicted permease
MIETLRQDIRHGARMLVRNPGFSVVAIVSIAVGVAACAAMFSVADGFALRPLPVPRASEVVTINGTTPVDRGFGTGLSYLDYVDVRDSARSFGGVTATRFLITSFARRQEDQAQSSIGFAVSGNLFDVMEIRPLLGRFFVAEEDRVPGRDAVVVLSHEMWTRQFGSDPNVLGQSLRLAGAPFTVIGVAPAGFTGLELVLPGAFYVPLAMMPAFTPPGQPDGLAQREIRMVNVKARLKPGVSVAQARAEVGQLGVALQQKYPAVNQRQQLIVRTHLESRRVERGPAAVAVAMLLVLAVTVLLVACANVAGLLTSRAPARAREMAVRLAIGAGRVRLARQLITETMLIAVAGGALGIGLGHLGIRMLRQLTIVSDIGVRLTLETDGRVLGFAAGLAALSALFAGLIPAVRSARLGDLSTTLRQGASDARGSRLWGRHVLVVGQVALSLALVTVAVFLYRTFGAELARGPGFRTDHVLIVNLNPGLAGYDAPRADAVYKRLTERVSALPGVTGVGLASAMPMNQDYRDFVTIAPEGYQLPPGTTSIRLQISRIDEGYLNTMQTRLVAGRGIRATDTAETPLVMVVNQTMAARYWPGQSPLGKRVRVRDSAWAEVVGVAADGKYNFITEGPQEFAYVARLQDPSIRSTLVVAAPGNAEALAAPIRDVVRSLDRELPITGIYTMEDYYQGNAINVTRTLTQTVGIMGLIGLMLAMVGLYGLVAYSVSRRTREIGIRMAVGAQPGSVLRMVLRHGALLAGAGTVVGVAITLAVNGLLRGMFPSSQGIDITVYLLAVPGLLALTLVAALIPARRAAHIDPLLALRQD